MASMSSNSPCDACKLLRRKCQPDCVFAPYFPQDQPQKFANVHKVFGASKVTKLLNELQPSQREDAVNSLAYEAEMRLQDPVYGCVGVISFLQHRLRQLQMDLRCAKSKLSKYQNLGYAGLMAAAHHHQNMGINLIGGAGGGGRDLHFHHHFFPRDHHHNHYHNHNRSQHQMIRDFDAAATANGNNCDASLLATNIGQPTQFQQPRAVAGDDSCTIDPS